MKIKKGISLIALVISIIVMVILSAITITFVTNITNQAAKSKFYEEMTQLNEQKELYKVMTKLDETTGQITETSFYSRKITPEELIKLDETLKAEIIYARVAFGDRERLKTSEIWKGNMYACQEMYAIETNLNGLAKDIRYVSGNMTASGKENVYLCDDSSNICFKVETTKIGKYTVHSLEYAKLVIDGVNARGVGVVEFAAGSITAGDGTKAYEPDLNNFSYTTEVVYYSPDFKTEYTMKIQDFIDAGKPSTKIIDGKKYTFANYSADVNRVWANIKTTANGLVSYWVWIPRYAHKIDTENKKIEVIFVNIDDKQMDGTDLPEGYTVHEGFKQKDGLKGIWFSKYAPTAVETVPKDNTEPAMPDLTNFDKTTLKLVYYTIDGKNSMEVDYTENPERIITDEKGTAYYWYNYTTKVWANIKTTANGLDAYWVWIPRYAYKLESGTSSIIFIDENNKPLDKEKYGDSLPNGYIVHNGFELKDGLKGIWFSKYAPTAVETVPQDKIEPAMPDLNNFDKTTLKLVYYTIDGKNSMEVDYTENPERIITDEKGTAYYWYNYTTKVWANIKTTANGLDAYWVWIPRYAYKLESGTTNIIFIDKDNKPLDKDKYGDSLPSGYIVHNGFIQKNGLNGIWFSKYAPTKVTIELPTEQ